MHYTTPIVVSLPALQCTCTLLSCRILQSVLFSPDCSQSSHSRPTPCVWMCSSQNIMPRWYPHSHFVCFLRLLSAAFCWLSAKVCQRAEKASAILEHSRSEYLSLESGYRGAAYTRLNCTLYSTTSQVLSSSRRLSSDPLFSISCFLS